MLNNIKKYLKNSKYLVGSVIALGMVTIALHGNGTIFNKIEKAGKSIGSGVKSKSWHSFWHRKATLHTGHDHLRTYFYNYTDQIVNLRVKTIHVGHHTDITCDSSGTGPYGTDLTIPVEPVGSVVSQGYDNVFHVARVHNEVPLGNCDYTVSVETKDQNNQQVITPVGVISVGAHEYKHRKIGFAAYQCNIVSLNDKQQQYSLSIVNYNSHNSGDKYTNSVNGNCHFLISKR